MHVIKMIAIKSVKQYGERVEKVKLQNWMYRMISAGRREE